MFFTCLCFIPAGEIFIAVDQALVGISLNGQDLLQGVANTATLQNAQAFQMPNEGGLLAIEVSDLSTHGTDNNAYVLAYSDDHDFISDGSWK